MREWILDGAAVADKKDLHSRLAEGLAFPEWYGGNLDALYDCLMDCDEVHVRVENVAALQKTLGDYAMRFFLVLGDAAEENPDLHVEIC